MLSVGRNARMTEGRRERAGKKKKERMRMNGRETEKVLLYTIVLGIIYRIVMHLNFLSSDEATSQWI